MDGGPGKRVNPVNKGKAQTEYTLVLGGFLIITVIGGLLMWRIYGLEFAILGEVVIAGGAVLFILLWLALKAMEQWAKSE
jgi:hypothetical protein